MKIDSRFSSGVTLVDLSGRLRRGDSGAVFDTLKDLVGKGQMKFMLNLRDVTDIDSSGLGELIKAYASVRRQGGELKFLHLSKKVQDLFQLTKLNEVFEVIEDEREAKAAFNC